MKLKVETSQGTYRYKFVPIFEGIKRIDKTIAKENLGILKKVCEHRRLCKVVDSNYFVTLCAEHLSESKTSDTAEAVNCNFN